MSNRKLIRAPLNDVHKQRPGATPQTERPAGGVNPGPPAGRVHTGAPRGAGERPVGGHPAQSGASSAQAMGRKRIPPPETNAEIFYYKKQMDAHTPMVIVLQDGEEIEGTIEWYDRAALKINRRSAPNVMLLKHNIKYMYKAEDRDGGGTDEDEG